MTSKLNKMWKQQMNGTTMNLTDCLILLSVSTVNKLVQHKNGKRWNQKREIKFLRKCLSGMNLDREEIKLSKPTSKSDAESSVR